MTLRQIQTTFGHKFKIQIKDGQSMLTYMKNIKQKKKLATTDMKKKF